MIFAAFGTAWLCWAALIVAGRASWLLAPAIAVGLGLFAVAWRRFDANRAARDAQRDSPQRRRIDRVFNWVNGGQWVLMIVLGNVLTNLGAGAWVPPMIVFIVGLHFLPLAAVMNYRPHYVCGAALMIHALVFPWLASAGPASFAGPLGTGLILWTSAVYGLVAGAPATAAEPARARV